MNYSTRSFHERIAPLNAKINTVQQTYRTTSNNLAIMQEHRCRRVRADTGRRWQACSCVTEAFEIRAAGVEGSYPLDKDSDDVLSKRWPRETLHKTGYTTSTTRRCSFFRKAERLEGRKLKECREENRRCSGVR